MICNDVHNILRLFDGWVNFSLLQAKENLLISNKLVYRSCRVASRVAKRF